MKNLLRMPEFSFTTQYQSKETSIKTQLELIREFAKQRGIEIVDEFYDRDSGGKASRENFDKMIKNALEGNSISS